jgi:hypothetical protein
MFVCGFYSIQINAFQPHYYFPNFYALLSNITSSMNTNLSIAHRIQVNGQKLYCKEYSRMKRRVCYVVCFVNRTIMSIQYFALNVNSGLVYAVGEILAVTADCFLNEKSGHHIVYHKYRKRFTVCTEIAIILGTVRLTIRGGRLRYKRYDAHFLKKKK